MNTPSRGVLLFSFNNSLVDYNSIAVLNKKRIEHFYSLPVTIVSDSKIDSTAIVIEDESVSTRHYKKLGQAIFRNKSRFRALELSPYDETILLDVDYIVNTPLINNIWNGKSLKVSVSAIDITGLPIPSDTIKLANDSLPMYWATIICFNKKCLASQKFFRNWKYIVDNYKIYQELLKFPDQLRNDFAVTLALYKTTNYSLVTDFDLPVPIVTAFENQWLEFNKFLVCRDESTSLLCTSDVHVINKRGLLECLKHTEFSALL